MPQTPLKVCNHILFVKQYQFLRYSPQLTCSSRFSRGGRKAEMQEATACWAFDILRNYLHKNLKN